MGRSRDSADIISNGQQATAWCTFDGSLTGTNAPTAGYNVTSVTRNSEGNYTITFSEAMDNVNYSWSGNCAFDVGSAGYVLAARNPSTYKSVGSFILIATNTSADNDAAEVTIMVFGGKD